MKDDYQFGSTVGRQPTRAPQRPDDGNALLWVLLVLSAVANGFLQLTGHTLGGIVFGLAAVAIIALLGRNHLRSRR